jgi:hypothetical protein
MKEWLRKNWMILGAVTAVVAAVVAGLVGYQTSNQNKTTVIKQIKTEITPTVSLVTPTLVPVDKTAPPAARYGQGPNSSPQEQAQQAADIAKNEEDYPLADLLPYKGDIFTIDHYREPKTLVVIVANAVNETAAEKEIKVWLKSNGAAPDSHTIVWEVGRL